ncbi:MAG TPA: NAD(P)/FAD-dependent oxidoreductase [Acidimicrobiales bacterium]|nr:NAD(P)/FAD-dependent oxidoreductase [Acidimicrobiales bacterium]
MLTFDCDVAVIGGGVGGGSAALAFAGAGSSVRLFERRDLARDPNRGDLLHPPTVAILRRLGLVELFEARGAVRLRGVSVVDPSGEIDLHTTVPGSMILNHAEMEAAFLDAAASAGATIRPAPARALVPDGDGWRVATDDGATRARLLVGADGAGSLTRRTLGIDLADDHEYDNCIVVLHATCPSWLEPDQGWQVIHPEGAVFILPTTPRGRVRLVVLIRRDDARRWMTAGEAQLDDLLGRRHPRLSGLDLIRRGGSHVYRLRRTHAARYTGPRAALVGDAAHTIHSMGGQGLNIAIQDSVKLAELVAPALHGGDGAAVAAALHDYEAVRRPINAEVIERADAASHQARPGADAFARALAFYRQAMADPAHLQRNRPSLGGREG